LNPANSTFNEYVPGNVTKRYEPLSSVTVVAVDFVPLFVKVTVAPGSTPPLLSWTVPRSVAVVEDWAKAAVLRARRVPKVRVPTSLIRLTTFNLALNMGLLRGSPERARFDHWHWVRRVIHNY